MLDEVRLLLEIIEAPCVDGYDKLRAQVYTQVSNMARKLVSCLCVTSTSLALMTLLSCIHELN
jgi:hypothetical protein